MRFSGDFTDINPDELVTALKERLQIIVKDAQERAPVDTGLLRDNIRLENVISRGDEVVGTIISAADYASHQEWGPKAGTQPKWGFTPHIRPAIEDNLTGLVEDIIKTLGAVGELDISVTESFEGD